MPSTLTTDTLRIEVSADGLALSSPAWSALSLSGLKPCLWVNGEQRIGHLANSAAEDDALVVDWSFPDTSLTLTWRVRIRGSAAMIEFVLANHADAPVSLEEVSLLGATGSTGQATWFGKLDRLRVFEQTNYWGSVRWADSKVDVQGRPFEAQGDVRSKSRSELVWLAYDTESGFALLAGFLSADRWKGGFDYGVDQSGRERWQAMLDVGKLVLAGGESAAIDPMIFQVGDDPWRLLESYGDLSAEGREAPLLEASPVTFCSWYPYRLGVSEELILANARAAAERLKPLGLKVMQLDLGWERGHLPAGLEESDLFPHGLKGLADRLGELGLDLGVWYAPYCILEFDPLAKEHPELLIPDETGQPKAFGTWFWEPHGKIFLLDLKKSQAQDWLRRAVASLVERGARYLKADFISMVGHELGRIGAAVTRDALAGSDGRAIYLSCGGPDIPGPGGPEIIYTCMDTGNTGFVSWRNLKPIFTTVACHLFKHRRWGVIQASCMCVGLPGTLGEARARATLAFLSGGEISLGDDLTTLPEDRWRILLATVPPLGISARVVDLFDPLPSATVDYAASTQTSSLKTDLSADRPAECGRVWDLAVETDWDSWHVVGLFDYGCDSGSQTYGSGKITMMDIPLDRLGLSVEKDYWVHEFWSGQSTFLPAQTPPTPAYQHPGDRQVLVRRSRAGTLSVGFFGPDVKLLVICQSRPHPWPLAASFHQSGGTEISQVRWDERSKRLSGRLNRPRGQSGTIYLSCAGRRVARLAVEGRDHRFRMHAKDVAAFDVTCTSDETRWEVTFD